MIQLFGVKGSCQQSHSSPKIAASSLSISSLIRQPGQVKFVFPIRLFSPILEGNDRSFGGVMMDRNNDRPNEGPAEGCFVIEDMIWRWSSESIIDERRNGKAE